MSDISLERLREGLETLERECRQTAQATHIIGYEVPADRIRALLDAEKEGGPSMTPCPVCRGKLLRYDDYTGQWGPEPCVACKGSGLPPRGRMLSDDAVARQVERQRVVARAHGNGKRAWAATEDAMLLAAEKRWRRIRRGPTSHKPTDWYLDLARRMHAAHPLVAIRSEVAIRQRIRKLLLQEE